MATRIRLKKVGRKKQATFRIVVAGGMHARSGRITETIGKYNPRTQPSYIEVDAGRALHWLREGAQMSESVNSLFRQAGILEKYAAGAEAEGVVVIGDPQGKTRLAASAAAVAPAPDAGDAAESEKAAEAKSEPKAKAKPEAKAAPAPDTAGEGGPGGAAPAPETAGEAKPAKAEKAAAVEADSESSEAQPEAAEDEKQGAES